MKQNTEDKEKRPKIVCFDVNIAKQHGITAAIIYNELSLLILQNYMFDIDCYDEKTWIELPYEYFIKSFPFLNKSSISKALNILRREKIIEKKRSKNSQNSWYALKDQEVITKHHPENSKIFKKLT